jgi:hypothetical protein
LEELPGTASTGCVIKRADYHDAEGQSREEVLPLANGGPFGVGNVKQH